GASFRATGAGSADVAFYGNRFYLGSQLDTFIQRSGIRSFMTNSWFTLDGTSVLIANNNTANQVTVGYDNAKSYFAGINFGSALDVNIYRLGVDWWGTDDTFSVPSYDVSAMKPGIMEPSSKHGGIWMVNMANRVHPMMVGYTQSWLCTFAARPFTN